MSKSTYCCVIIQCIFFLFFADHLKAQTTKLEHKTDDAARLAIRYLNAGLPDSVYQMAGMQFKKNLSHEVWNNAYKQFTGLLPFTKTTFISSKDSVNKYKLEGKMTLTYYISLDRLGKLNSFSFVPYQEEISQPLMSAGERKTDTLARKILSLINHKQADSIYLFAGDAFKNQIGAQKWKSIAENGFYPLTPLPESVFTGSKNGVNMYKMLPYQFMISLDSQGKFSTLALRPYKEDAVKAAKVLSDNPLKTHLDSIAGKVLSAYIQTKGNVGLSAGIYYQGKSYFYNYGETNTGSGQLPTLHTLYDIGSITKTFTSTLLARAVNSGKVSPAAWIIRFLPDSVAANPDLKNITFQELANHTSGLPRLPDNFQSKITDPNQPYANYDVKAMFSFLKHFRRNGPPGSHYAYSNFAAGLLGVLLERIYHKPYQELIRQYITGPAKMHETQFTADHSGVLAQGYNELNLAVPPWSFLAMQGAGALKSTASDLLAYSKLQLYCKNQPLNAALKLTHRITFDDGTNIVGLGWHYLADDKHVLQHGGGTGGYRSMICVDTDRRITVVVLTNNATTGDALGIELIKAIL